ncbi:MAG: class I SAM-dependent methyltransferase [Cytophagales bacterium]|nr:class I SAM-dependent methyltransferase [Cytophagales bacterium]MDW8383248.1 class I SAM-dependent methyltransferase [Flammeovirgaceae bacterium]
MINYSLKPIQNIVYNGKIISSFITGKEQNIDQATVDAFGEEWTKFASFSNSEIQAAGDEYFDIVPPQIFDKERTIALDLGCGTGRWAKYLASKVKFVEAIDPSKAVFSAVDFTTDVQNIRISQASVESIPFPDESFDFVMSLGVLHHVPDTQEALNKLVKKLKIGGYCLIYLYYALDNRPFYYKGLFYISNFFRWWISRLPNSLKKMCCDIIAILGYMPFVVLARFVKKLFPTQKYYEKVPLFYYINKSFHIIRNDALDRFGTPLEQRFTKQEVIKMMENAGLADIVVSPHMPCWHAIGKRKK